jgi:hypothetical protein
MSVAADDMPTKYTMTWSDRLAYTIHKASLRKEDQFTDEDRRAKVAAVLIASFSSCHSWRTHKCITEGMLVAPSTEIKEEFSLALSERWRNVSSADVREVATAGITDSMFSRWMFSNVDKERHAQYREAWNSLKNGLANYTEEEPEERGARELPVSIRRDRNAVKKRAYLR